MSETEPSVAALIFDQCEHPCPQDQLIAVYSYLEQQYQHLVDHEEPQRPWVASARAELAAILSGRGSTPEEMHRHLLATRRRLGRHGSYSYGIDSSLEAVRKHSPLYTPRSCWCVQRAWDVFRTEADAALGGVRGIWAVADKKGAWSDLDRELTLDSLMAYTGRDRPRNRSKRVEVLIESGSLIRLREGTARRMREWTLTRLTAPEEQATLRVRYSSRGAVRSAGSWVRQWPQPLLLVFNLWTSHHHGRGDGRSVVEEMLALGVADLEPAVLTTALRLIPQWKGTLQDLVGTAVAVGEGQGAAKTIRGAG